MIYVTGDMHADLKRFASTEMRKLKKNDTLLICGDFGFIWDGTKDEQKLLKKLGKKRYNIAFVDGTHENFELLYAYEETEWMGGKVHHIGGNLYHLMRGQIYEIEGQRIYAFGGGESQEKEIRFENGGWWREELPNTKELYEGAENIEKAGCKVDYIITHEPPGQIKDFLRLKSKEYGRNSGLNGYFQELAGNCQFKRWYFGSMHRDQVVTPQYTAVFRALLPVTRP